MNIFPLMRGFWRSFKKACERKKGVFGVDLSGVVPLNPRCLVDRRCRGALGSISRELLSTQQENGCRSSDLWPKTSWQMFYWACFVCVCVCACVRVSLIDTTLTNWDTIHIVYFQLPWKSREIWPCSPGKQQSGWRTAICLDTVTRLSSPRSPTPPIPFIFPTRRPLGSSFITVRGMLFVLL